MEVDSNLPEKATIVIDEIPDSSLDRWTDDQESALLRACVQWKPVGMHKHFRMIAIRGQLLSEGLINEPDEHTSVAGIWKKLGSLYDLQGLDEREDSQVTDTADNDMHNYWRDFELPRDDFEALMWDRRLAPDGTSSPEMSRRESTVADTDEPRSSPVPGKVSTRGRGGARKSGRLSRLQNELETDSRSKSASVVDEDTTMEDLGEGEGDEDSGEGEDESEEEDHEEDDKRGAKKTARGGRRGRGRGRGRVRRG
jgi:MRG-binding protein